MAADIELKQIVAPQLEESSYGKGVATQFDNIDRNFKLLGNRDFVRGATGLGIKAQSVKLGETPTDPECPDWLNGLWLYNQIHDCIDSAVVNPWESESIENECYSTLSGSYVIVYYQEDENGQFLQSLGIQPYPFIDGRLSNKTYIQQTDETAELIKRPDLTCVVVTAIEEVEEEEVISFERVNAFPTIYYDAGVGAYCWKIDENESGIVAEGPKGADGQNGYIVIAKINTSTGTIQIDGNQYCRVSNILDVYNGSGWIAVDDNTDNPILKTISDLTDADRHYVAAFAFDNGEDRGPYVSYIFHMPENTLGVEPGYYVTQNEDAKIDLSAEKFTVTWWMKNLYYQNAITYSADPDMSYQQGLFVPFIKGMGSGSDGAHIMYAIKNGNLTGKKLVVAPITDIKSIDSNGDATIDANATMELRYKNIDYVGGLTNGSKVNISDKSVQTVFNSLYITRDGVPNATGEKRFAYIWKSNPTSGSFPEPDSTENRPQAAAFASNVPQAYICHDGFLWYRDPYSYLRIQIGNNGKVSIVGPTNGDIATGNVTLTPSTATIEADAQSTNINMNTDAYWNIN